MKNSNSRVALRHSLIYGVTAAFYIVLSDQLVRALFSDRSAATWVQTYKGFGFVAITTWLLYSLLKSNMRRWENEAVSRRQAEEALQVSEIQYRSMVENAVGGIFRSTPEGQFLRVNKALADMCGYASPEEMIAKIKDMANQHYTNPQDRELFKKHLQEQGMVRGFEHEVFRKDGSTFWTSVSARIVRNDQGKILFYEGSHENIDQKKTADKLLADAEEQYRSLFEYSTNAILIRNREGIITMVNEAALSLLGASSVSDLIGKSYLDLVHPEDRAMSAQRIEIGFAFIMEQQRSQEKRPNPISPREHRMIRLDGEMIHVESTGVTFPYKNAFFIQGIFRDITERKRAEEALQISEAEAQRLSNENLILARIGQIISSTLNIDEVYDGFTREVNRLIPFDGIAINIIHHEASLVSVPYASGVAVLKCAKGDVFPLEGSMTGQIMATRESVIAQLADEKSLPPKFQTLSGGYELGLRWVMAVPLIAKDRVIGAMHLRSCTTDPYSHRDLELAERVGLQIAGAIANAHLFEKQQKDEAALRESEERYRLVAENVSDVIWIRDMELKCTYVSPSIERLTGYSVEEAKKLTLEQTYSADSIAKNRLIFQEELTLEKEGRSDPFRVRTLEFEAFCKDGTQIWTEARIIFTRDVSGRINGLQGVSRDITERKRAEEEKARLEAQLVRSQKMEALGLLAGGVAHDLNNVLTGIVSYPDLLLLDLPQDSPLRKPIMTIQNSGQKAASIVQDLLTLARRGVIYKEIVNLNDLVLDYLRSPEHEKLIVFHPGIKINIDLEEDLPYLEGSAIHLRKSIMNLISNAAEAQPEGGEIWINTRSRYLDKPFKGYETIQEGDYAILSVQDKGVGISAEDLGRIFEPFYTKKVMGRSGTGLGMAVVWGTVQDHKGYIHLESALGQGTLFELSFPITRKALVQEKTDHSLEPYQGKGEQVLVVDDILEQREISVQMLHRLGYQATAVASGEEALEYLKNNRSEFLLLDMIMDPGIDGLETYKRAKAIYPQQKAVLASGFSETDRVLEAQKLGAGVYIKKPYTLEKLGEALKKESFKSERHED
jgi:PAS domain S-box-containing protein